MLRIRAVLLTAFIALAAIACTSLDGGDAQPTPTETAIPPTIPPTSTATSTPTPTSTPIPTATPSPTPSPTPTATPSPTPTATPEPPTLAITDLSLHDIDGSPLQFLSTDEHPYFGGFTLVNGTIEIEGEGEIAAVTLEITDTTNGASIEVELAQAAREQILLPLDEAGQVAIATSQLLFEIPSTAFAEFDKVQDGYVEMRVRVRATDGREAVYESADLSQVQKLVRYTAENRYFIGEEDQGGNSWVTPNVKALVEQFQDVEFGDFSNMNGGPFPPHVSHQRGLDVDTWFYGYNNLDGTTAQGLLDLLNQPGIIERVELVYVAYTQTDGDLFWEAIRDVVLVDGRRAGEVFLPEPEHTTHFHLRFWE
jgi:Penicillin-insensitive murein endopeptidase